MCCLYTEPNITDDIRSQPVVLTHDDLIVYKHLVDIKVNENDDEKTKRFGKET
jgi:hypothetical protein